MVADKNQLSDQYNELTLSHELPQFSELQQEFDIANDPSPNPLEHIRKSMAEKLEAVLEILESIVSPEQRISDMHEQKLLSDQDRKKAWELFRTLMSMSRESNRLFVLRQDKETAEYINYAFSKWKHLKIDIMKIIAKMRDSWNEETDSESDIGYFG